METNDFNIRITKSALIHEVNNDMAHNYYYLINFRLENKKERKYCALNLVQWIDLEDALGYYEKDSVSKKEIAEFAKDCAFGAIETRINDYHNRKKLFDYCAETIENYNRIVTF